ncbi:hypothetical protein BKN37_22785 [Mycobacterium talmoniae]|uniref:Metalloprotease n=1 Tax=Mycobacterium talmoniae TaxID=1858794 RepID=A0A1S1N9P5_9MYCO|nr:hypothetical protein BKN37_22785 [Mycobacterium talmoniae]
MTPAATAAPVPPKTRPIIPIVLGAAAIVVALIVVAGAVVVVAKKGTTSTASGPMTTASALTSVPTTATTTSYPTSTTRRTTRTSTSTTKATPTGTAALQGNPLFANFGAGLARQACNSVGWPFNNDAAKVFFDSVTPCLDTVWRSLVTTTTGLTYRSPQVLVPTGTVITSPCGTEEIGPRVAAFYCPGNQTLYMPPSGLQVDENGNQPIIYIAVFAHEFGHHIQEVTGISSAAWQQMRAEGVESAAGLEMSRRLELEAQCFSGMFVGSIVDSGGMFTQADYQTAYEDQLRGDHTGGPRDHGTDAHAQGWWRQGGDTGQIGQCNTWLAPPSDVS